MERSKDGFAQDEGVKQVAFMKALQDQVTYLGHDFNPGAVASLKPADKLNAQAKELYSAIDKTTAAATSNVSQLSAN